MSLFSNIRRMMRKNKSKWDFKSCEDRRKPLSSLINVYGILEQATDRGVSFPFFWKFFIRDRKVTAGGHPRQKRIIRRITMNHTCQGSTEHCQHESIYSSEF